MKHLLIAAFVIRITIAFIYPVVGDEHIHIAGARYIAENWKYPSENVLITTSNVKFFYPPLMHAVFAAIISLFSLDYTNYNLLKLLSAVAGTISVWFSYKLFEELNLKYSFEAAAVVAFLPITVIYSAIVYLDIYVLMFVSAGAYYFVRFLNKGRKKDGILFVVLNAAAALTNYSGLSLTLFSLLMFMKNKKHLKVVLLGGIAASPFYLRNLILYKSPFWAGFDGALTQQAEFNLLYSFYSFWIGGPSSGPLFERMINFLPQIIQPAAYLWTLAMALFTLIMIVGIFRMDSKLKLLILSVIPPFLYQPQAASKLIAAVPALAYGIVKGIPENVKKEYIVVALIIFSAHYLPLSWMLKEKWEPFRAEYDILVSECSSVLTSEFGRISINTDLKVYDFGELGVELGNNEEIVSDAEALGIDCIFHDEYTLERMLKENQKQKIMELNEYLNCGREEVNGLGYYLCKI